MFDNATQLTKRLVSQASITPEDAGLLDLLSRDLLELGFLRADHNRNEVKNALFAYGSGSPVLVFSGHLDVVPPGNLDLWTHPPFEPFEKDGYIYGRGTSDMKGNIAAWLCGMQAFIQTAGAFKGTILIALTSDEEGDAIDGSRVLAQEVSQEYPQVDLVLVGEPSSAHLLGDTIRIGRRGSLTGRLKVFGKQGHVAYPQLAQNAIHLLSPILQDLQEMPLDSGTEFFPPTSFQLASLNTSNTTANIIPGEAGALFNFRFNNLHSFESLEQQVDAICQKRLSLDAYNLSFKRSASPFLNKQPQTIQLVQRAIHQVMGYTAEGSTAGGTSDGRFFASHGMPVVELGVTNSSIHKIDERVAIDELEGLQKIYQEILQIIFLKAATAQKQFSKEQD